MKACNSISRTVRGGRDNPHEKPPDEAVALAGSVGDDVTVVRVLNNIAFPLLVPPLLERSLAWTADALRRAERLGDPVLLFWAAHTRANVAARAGDIDEMHRCYDTAGALAGQLDQPMLNWVHGFNCACGPSWPETSTIPNSWPRRAVAIGSDGRPTDAKMFYGVQMMAASFDRGTFGELVPPVEQRVADVSDRAATFAPWRAVAHVEAGRIDDARRLLEAFAATNFDYPM